MQIREMMTKQVEVLPPHASIRDAAARMRDLDVGGIPICDGQKLQGFLTDRDLAVRAVAEARDPANTKVSEVMSPNITYCFERKISIFLFKLIFIVLNESPEYYFKKK